MTTYHEDLHSDPPVSPEEAHDYEHKPKRRLKLDPNLADGQHWTIHDRPDATLMELIQLWMDEATVGESIEITLVEKTDAEVEALPDI